MEDDSKEEILLVDSSAVIKNKLKNVLFCKEYCGLCFEPSTEFVSVYTSLEMIGDFGIHNLVLKDVINYVFKNEIADNIIKPCLCLKCLDNVYKSYLFLSNTEYNMKTMHQYLVELDERTFEIDDRQNTEKVTIFLHHNEIQDDVDISSQIIATSGFICSKCSTFLPTYSQLVIHENNHKWKSQIQCKLCSQTVYKKAYHEHLKLRHRNEVFACTICSNAYLSYKSLTSHMKTHEPEMNQVKVEPREGQLYCELCSKNIDDSSFKTHKCRYMCPDCDDYKCIHFDYLLACAQMRCKTKFSCPKPCTYTCKYKPQFIIHINKEHLDYHPFTCDVCNQQFYSKRTVRNHIVMYHSEMLCEYCDKNYSDGKVWTEHVDICKSVIREFKCSECVASFDTIEGLSNHECKKFSCHLCNFKFTKKFRLGEHMTKVHSGIQILSGPVSLTCPVCKEIFSKVLEFRRHLSTHGDGVQWDCDECDKKCITREKLKHHKYNCHRKVECPVCNQMIKKIRLADHLNSHTGDDGKPKFACEFCGLTFIKELHLVHHRQRHTAEEQCEICSKLIHKGRMKRHMKYHRIRKRLIDNDRFLRAHCKQCDYRCHNQLDLDAHVNQVHLKIRPFVCGTCNKAFCGKYDLDKHIGYVHRRKIQIICTICNANLVNKNSFKKHMASHTGIKPHKCDLCEAKFATIGQVTQHKIRNHTVKQIICPLPNCSVKFAAMPLMRRHVKRVHWKTKDKPFDPRQLKGLHERHLYLFEDRRRRQIVED